MIVLYVLAGKSMALLDVFRKKKKRKVGAKKEEKVKVEKKKEIEKPTEELKESRKEEVVSRKKRGEIEAWRALREPHVTEKATDLVKKNQYVFRVVPKANKTEIKKAIENLYGVDVLNVKIINIPKKQRRLGKQRGWRKGYKKAIVKIKEGQKIEVLPR